jgi:hypothetical protein
MHRDNDGMLDGFLAACQTGFDLFRPLVTLRLRGSTALPSLLQDGLQAGRPYLVVSPLTLLEKLQPILELTQLTRSSIYRLDPTLYRPEMNALVIRKTDAAGNPRAEIRAGDLVAAAAGVNWRSPLFAEVFVNVEEPFERKGYGRSVVMAVVAEVIKLGVTPLYTVGDSNTASKALAEKVGFVDTGAQEFMAQAVRSG